MGFIPNTDKERAEMLCRIGVKKFDSLLSTIPENVKLKSPFNLPPPLSEFETKKMMEGLSKKNRSTDDYISFLGAGSYDHYIPAAVDYVCQRPEFYTAYTPYQAEASQGTLQAIYEYQSMICELTGMEVANASMYDGATALAEACHMARSITDKKGIIISDGVHPNYIRCVETYFGKISRVPIRNGVTDISALKNILQEQAVACVAIQHPNFFGLLEPVFEINALVHKNNAIYIGIPLPISLGVLVPPGEWGADIVVAEGQTLGIPQSFGGPGIGIFASKKEWIRRMPGRIIGRTQDVEGRRGFVMTLQTREQHIKRERATSNICTNEGLCAIAVCVYLTIMGPHGIREVAELCYHKAHYLADRIVQIPGFSLVYNVPFFNEFLVHTPVPADKIVNDLLDDGIFAGVPMSKFYSHSQQNGREIRQSIDFIFPPTTERSEVGVSGEGVPAKWQNDLLIAVTEKRTRQEMDYFVDKLKEILKFA